MSDLSRSARKAMKEKAYRLGDADPHQKVDASSWSPPEPLDTEMKVGLRPVSRQHRKRGGKVDGKHAHHHAGRRPRAKGGRLADEIANTNMKEANEERSGAKRLHGGFKRGGRARKDMGGPLATPLAAGMGGQGRFGFNFPGVSRSPMLKRGGRARRADGGVLDEASEARSLPPTPTGGGQGYDPVAVNKAIAASNRAGRRIGASEAAKIHALLRGRYSKGGRPTKAEIGEAVLSAHRKEHAALKRERGGSVADGRLEGTRPTGGRLAHAKGGKAFHTKSGGVSAHGRREAREHGETMPGTGGKFPIRNKADLAKAKHDIGRTTEPKAKVEAWIDKRARELGGREVGERKGRKAGGRTKGKTNINIVIAQPHSGAPMAAAPGAMPPRAAPMPMPVPTPPPGGLPVGLPMGMGAGAPPIPQLGAPVPPPMGRKRGGSVHMTASPQSGEGRLQKARAYGAKAAELDGHYRRGGQVRGERIAENDGHHHRRAHIKMDHGSVTGLGMREKADKYGHRAHEKEERHGGHKRIQRGHAHHID